jgi:hypothetical protein
VGYKPLKEQFPSLFNIVHYSHDTVVNVMNQNPLNISFRRAVAGDKLTSWQPNSNPYNNFHKGEIVLPGTYIDMDVLQSSLCTNI